MFTRIIALLALLCGISLAAENADVVLLEKGWTPEWVAQKYTGSMKLQGWVIRNPRTHRKINIFNRAGKLNGRDRRLPINSILEIPKGLRITHSVKVQQESVQELCAKYTNVQNVQCAAIIVAINRLQSSGQKFDNELQVPNSFQVKVPATHMVKKGRPVEVVVKKTGDTSTVILFFLGFLLAAFVLIYSFIRREQVKKFCSQLFVQSWQQDVQQRFAGEFYRRRGTYCYLLTFKVERLPPRLVVSIKPNKVQFPEKDLSQLGQEIMEEFAEILGETQNTDLRAVPRSIDPQEILMEMRKKK